MCSQVAAEETSGLFWLWANRSKLLLSSAQEMKTMTLCHTQWDQFICLIFSHIHTLRSESNASLFVCLLFKQIVSHKKHLSGVFLLKRTNCKDTYIYIYIHTVEVRINQALRLDSFIFTSQMIGGEGELVRIFIFWNVSAFFVFHSFDQCEIFIMNFYVNVNQRNHKHLQSDSFEKAQHLTLLL